MDLSTPLETICRLIIRARELEAQVPAADSDDEEDPTDSDDKYAVLEDEANEAIEEEISALLDDLGDDQVQEILALAWVGRGTYDASEWDEALETAADPDTENPVDQLLDMPTLAAYLDAGLAAFELSCEGMGQID
jgi:hypothetical protein